MIYFMSDDKKEAVKIGFSDDPKSRRGQLQTGNPSPLHCLGIMDGDKNTEDQIHMMFEHLRRHGDWFTWDKEIDEYIKKYCCKGYPPSTEMMAVTPEIAEDWVLNYSYEKQRKVRPQHVKLLANEMRKGRFQPTSQVAFAVMSGKGKFLVNGQHTLRAIIQAGIPQIVNIIHHLVSSEHEIAELYFCYDIHLRRTLAEIATVYDVPENTGLTMTQINYVGSAAVFIEADFRVTRTLKMPLADRCDLVVEYAEAAKMYLDAVKGADSDFLKKLYRKATMAIGLVTFRYASDKYGIELVEKFWQQVAEDNGITRDDPRKVAHCHLQETQMPSGRGIHYFRDFTDAAYSARYLARCWNAWPERTKLYKITIDPSEPIDIKGTPWQKSLI